MDTLKQRYIDMYTHWLTTSLHAPESAGHLQAIIDILVELTDANDAAPVQTTPLVDRYLADILAQITAPTLQPFASELSNLSPSLYWDTVPNAYLGETFAQNYAVCRLACPTTANKPSVIYASEQIYAGITLQGPHIYYPPHRHKAVEFYGILSGTAQWQQGDGAWEAKEPGSFIYHESDIMHAMQTNDEPLLACYVWIGDIFSPIEF